ncbi:hypothetical protein V8E53_015295 [Lactarius tabidus]
MPVCPHPQCPCGHKNLTPDVLNNHVESSPWAALYFCAICRCVCKSESVLILHKQKVHKTNFSAAPTFAPTLAPTSVPTQQSRASLNPQTPHACRICDRAYVTASALVQHYRDTPVHPKCTRCNIGFVDNTAIQAHVIATHRPITCNICNGIQVYGEDVARHYKISTNHPSCTICDVGFENKDAFDEHNNTRHPQVKCKTCNIPFGSLALLDAHYRDSPRHPRCPECQLSFEDNLALSSSASYRSDTVSPVSSAQSIFGRAASITSIPREQTTTTVPHSDISLTHPASSAEEVSSTKGSLTGSARGRGSSRQSFSSDFLKGDPRHSPRTVSRASAKTCAAHYLRRLQELPRQLSLIDNLSKATGEPRLTRWHPSSFVPDPTAGPEALNTTPQLPSRERFVSHVYCRMCRRDPCRQPAATMCGHIFCHQCISSEVVKTSQCPVCETPTLLYSIFRLHLA